MNVYNQFANPGNLPTNTAVSTICVADTSGSMEWDDYKPSRLGAACKAIEELINEKKRIRPIDYVGIVGFNNISTIYNYPENVGESADSLINSLYRVRAGGGTNFIAGLETAYKLFFKRTKKSDSLFLKLFDFMNDEHTDNKSSLMHHIIFLSDGDHNSYSNPVEITNELKKNGCRIDCIGIGGTPADVNEKLLKEMASTDNAGNPRYRFIGDTQSLIKDFRKMANLRVCS